MSGTGAIDLAPGDAAALDCSAWLKSRKSRKFMGRQDELAVIAAGQALAQARLPEGALRDRTGIYLAVGFIPFEQTDIEPMARHSIRDGAFSMSAFATAGIEQVNPLLTFRCLPNMPIFHVSLNFGIQGAYFVTYPGVGQFYLALERAIADLEDGLIDHALVGGTADQNNFLVQWHFARLGSAALRSAHDVAAFLCLEKASHAQARGASAAIELIAWDIEYRPGSEHREQCEPGLPGQAYRGPASLAAALALHAQQHHVGPFAHSVHTFDAMHASSRWRFL